MAQLLTEMSKDLTLACIEAKFLVPEDMQKQLAKTHARLLELKTREDHTFEGGVGRADRKHTGSTRVEKKHRAPPSTPVPPKRERKKATPSSP